MNIGFQGEKGAYSELVIIKHFGSYINTIGYKEFADVFNALEKKKIDYGVLPIENSITGSINENYDLLLKNKCFIVGEILLRIEHCLISHKGIKFSDIRKSYSHPQALSQCKEFLEKYDIKPIAEYDTAGSAKIIIKKKKKDEAIIASELAAKVYNLGILRKNIETDKTNTTRFIVISNNEYDLEKLTAENSKTSLIFRTKHKPGALVNCLIGFRDNKVNLTKIESRPIKNKPWEYSFYLDFEGSKNDNNVKNALKTLNKNASFVRIFGSYPKGRFI